MNKVLIYTDCYVYGGSERLMSFLVKNPLINAEFKTTLAYRKHRIYEKGLNSDYTIDEKYILRPISILSNDTIFHFINCSKWPSTIKFAVKIPFYLLSTIGIYFIYNLFSQLSTLITVAPDIIHINNGGYPGARSCNTMVFAVRLLGKKPIVYQVNNIAFPPKSAFQQMIDRYINNNVKVFITASNLARNSLIALRKFDSTKIIRLPNTVKEEIPSQSRQILLKDLGISNNCFIITVVAFLSERKGHIYLLKALQLIKNRYHEVFENLKLLLIGNGEDELKLKKFVSDNGLQQNVMFLGYQTNSINFIEACDLFVLPSIYGEDMPLVILTAMSRAKVILATDFAGIKEAIKTEVSGILVPLNISTLAETLSENIVALYFNRSNSYGKEAYDRFNKLFSNEAYGNSIIELYKRLL